MWSGVLAPGAAGASVSTGLLLIGKFGFRYYLLWFKADDPLNIIYGSVALIPVFLVWLYLVWVVVYWVLRWLICAKFQHIVGSRRRAAPGARTESPLSDVATVLAIFVELAKQHETIGRPISPDKLAMDVGLSTRSLRPVMDIIAQRGWVVESEWG